MACVNRRYRPFRGKAARKRGCENFRALPGSGFAHHPYTLRRRPRVRAGHRDDVTIGYLAALVKALNRLGRKNRLKRDADEDLGHGVRLPDRSARSVPDADRKVPGFMGQSEWLAYRNPRVASHSQYLLRTTAGHSRLPDGIRFAGGKAKPGVYKAYRLPFFVRHRGGRKIEVWGGIRAAGRASRVTIQSKRGGKWRRLGRATTGKQRLLPQASGCRPPASGSTASRARATPASRLRAR